jgi:Asp-tRNA(Asn)/Glu-tRNA(Gln) amidotransferase A subunit family amidase
VRHAENAAMTPIALDPRIAPDGFIAPAATAIARAVARGTLSAAAAMQAALARIAACEPALHAWETLDEAQALSAARAVDSALAAGAPGGLLAGVPLGVKDILDTADWPTGCGTAIHRGARPRRDAACVALARAAGAVVAGKTVTTELAYFTPGPTANPHDTTRTPGGSSSGSAAAVAAGMVPLAFGTQTAGSVIRPASFCGVFALKVGFGAVSLAGAKAFAPSLDTLGWFARSADDLELMRCALAQVPFAPLVVPPATALRIAVCRTHEEHALDAGGAQAWQEAQRRAPVLRTVAMPATLAGLLEAQKTVMAFEAARSLASEWQAHRAQLSDPLGALLQAGHAIAEETYRRALDLARSAGPVVEDLMRDADALMVPAAPGEAPRGLEATGDPVFSRVWTLLGLPCVNVPGLRGPAGMPVGMQLVGRQGEERRLLEIAASLHRIL